MWWVIPELRPRHNDSGILSSSREVQCGLEAFGAISAALKARPGVQPGRRARRGSPGPRTHHPRGPMALPGERGPHGQRQRRAPPPPSFPLSLLPSPAYLRRQRPAPGGRAGHSGGAGGGAPRSAGRGPPSARPAGERGPGSGACPSAAASSPPRLPRRLRPASLLCRRPAVVRAGLTVLLAAAGGGEEGGRGGSRAGGADPLRRGLRTLQRR